MDTSGLINKDSSTTPNTSIIDQLLPTMNQAPGSFWSNPSSMPPIYSPFSVDPNYSHDDESSLFGANNQQAHSSSSFYDSLNFGSDSGRIFNIQNDVSGNNLIDNLNNQLNTSDSSNNFSGNSSFSGSRGRADPINRQFTLNKDDSSGPGRTYSSVLHSNAQPELSTLQQQQQQQLQLQQQPLHQANRSSSFLHQQSPMINNSDLMRALGSQQSSLVPTNYRQYQQMNNRFIDNFLSGTSQQQQQHQHQHRHYPLHQRVTRQQHSINTGGPSGRGPATSNFNPRNSSDKMFSYTVGGGAPGQSASKPRNKSPFFAGSSQLGEGQPGFKLDAFGTGVINSEESERYSRKVFVGGLPPDIDEEEIKASFRRFGSLVVDWPHKAESKSYFPPKGYAFLLFQEEVSVQSLIDSCFQEGDKLYLCVSSPTIKDKPVQIRPWRLNDSDFVLDSTLALDPRKTVFVGGVPRPLKSYELATIMNNLYGGVCYAGIDTDPDLKYPKGAGRVAFSDHQSYIAAISARFVHIHHGEIEKRVEVKPYVLDDQFCDECQGARCNNKFAPFFCANILCLRYYCDNCWSTVHSKAGKEFHKPLVKEGGDRPRGSHQAMRWMETRTSER